MRGVKWKATKKQEESCLQEFALLRRFHLTEVGGLSSLHRPAMINNNKTLKMINGATASDYGHLEQVLSPIREKKTKQKHIFSDIFRELVAFLGN